MNIESLLASFGSLVFVGIVILMIIRGANKHLRTADFRVKPDGTKKKRRGLGGRQPFSLKKSAWNLAAKGAKAGFKKLLP